MGNYCDPADLVDRFGDAQLASYADLDGDGAYDAETVAAAISDAEAHIDSYLGEVYTVPVTPVPDVLRKRTAAYALYYLQLWQQSVTDDVQREIDRINKWLAAIVAGQAGLGTATPPADAPGAGGIRSSSQDRVYGRDKTL